MSPNLLSACKKHLIEEELENVLQLYRCRFEKYDVNITQMTEASPKVKSNFTVNLQTNMNAGADLVFFIYNAAFTACGIQGLICAEILCENSYLKVYDFPLSMIF